MFFPKGRAWLPKKLAIRLAEHTGDGVPWTGKEVVAKGKLAFSLGSMRVWGLGFVFPGPASSQTALPTPPSQRPELRGAMGCVSAMFAA